MADHTNAAIFIKPGRIIPGEKPIPAIGAWRFGGAVAAFARGPIGPCAGARLTGATTILAVDDIEAAHELFAHQPDGVLKIATQP